MRIEDIDATRCRTEYTDAIVEDLNWLGFAWPEPVRVQSEHLEDYRNVAERLKSMGVIYPCDLSRKAVAERTVDGVFRGTAIPGKDAPWRLDVRKAAERVGPQFYRDNGEQVGVDFARVSDEIVVRRDIGTSYFIACTHDDAVQGMTHVVRGEDLRGATPVQVILQALLGWDTPNYIHHALVRDGGRKLSKSDGDTAIRAWRDRGPDAVWAELDERHETGEKAGTEKQPPEA